ncbi:hypothetical protein ABI59_13385 [Acidobacteria bacterium Mor1]|nr:hypothetical protein ABI59_13385 [Acidobacteria bacterium Mor1]
MTLHIESVYTVEGAESADIAHVEQVSDHEHVVSVLSSDATEEFEPRIAIDDSGRTWIAWTLSDPVKGDSLRVATREATGEPFEVHDLSTFFDDIAARRPELTVFGDAGWIAYEADRTDGTYVAAGVLESIQDKPDPIFFVGHFEEWTGSDAPDVLIQQDGESMWVSWVENHISVKWSTWEPPTPDDGGAWSAPHYLLYGIMQLSVPEARDCVLQLVQGSPDCD